MFAFHRRHLLQVGFVDRMVGQLVARLKELNLYDECLLVITTDHGNSFRTGHHRRAPQRDNVLDLLCVPLLVKAPGQTKGVVDDRNVSP